MYGRQASKNLHWEDGEAVRPPKNVAFNFPKKKTRVRTDRVDGEAVVRLPGAQNATRLGDGPYMVGTEGPVVQNMHALTGGIKKNS